MRGPTQRPDPLRALAQALAHDRVQILARVQVHARAGVPVTDRLRERQAARLLGDKPKDARFGSSLFLTGPKTRDLFHRAEGSD